MWKVAKSRTAKPKRKQRYKICPVNHLRRHKNVRAQRFTVQRYNKNLIYTNVFVKKTIKYNKIGENLKKTHLFLNNRTYGGGNSLKTNTITKIQQNKCNKTSHDRDRICIVFVVVSFGIRTDK